MLQVVLAALAVYGLIDQREANTVFDAVMAHRYGGIAGALSVDECIDVIREAREGSAPASQKPHSDD